MKRYQITENNITYDIEEYEDGDKYWYLNGKLHREDGPADESFSGNRRWYKNGLLHRDNGPAIWTNIIKEYWYNGCHLKNINSDKDLKRYIKLQSIS